MTAPVPITALPDAPVRGDAPATFSTKANAFVAALPVFVTETNAAAVVTYNNALDSAQTVADATAQADIATAQAVISTTQAGLAQDYAEQIASNVNFQGNWSDQVGAAAVPYSVYHNSRFWQLRVNVADITASEPSLANSDWALAGGDVGTDSAKSLLANELRVVTITTLPDVPIVSASKETAQVAVTSAFWNMTADDASFSYAAPVQISSGVTMDAIGATYDSVSLNISSQDTSATGIFFKPDGTKMYVLGSFNDTVYQYSLPTPWVLTGATYDGVSFSVGAQETSPNAVFFKDDGTKMYVVGLVNDTVYQYTLPTPWVLTGATYDTVSFSVNAQAGSPRGMFFKSDGTKFYIANDSTNIIYQYTLPTPWVLTGASYDSVSFSVASQTTTTFGLAFKDDGTKMYVVGGVSDVVYQYSLPNAWSLSGATYDSAAFSIAAQDPDPWGIFFKSDGTKFYVVGNTNDRIYQYSLADAWSLVQIGYQPAVTTDAGQIDTTNWTDINSASITQTLNGGTIHYALSTDDRATWYVVRNGLGSRNIVRNNAGTYQYNSNTAYASTTWTNAAVNTLQGAIDEAAAVESTWGLSNAVYASSSFLIAQDTIPQGIFIKPDGLKMYVLGDTNNTVYQYSLGTAGVVSSAIYDSISFSVGAQETSTFGLFFKSDGTKMYIVGGANDTVYQYTLPTPWVLTGATYDTVSFSVNAQATQPLAMFFKSDGSKLYVLNGANDTVYQYTLPTPWVMTGASYDSVSFSVATQEATPTGMTFKSDGTKMYIVGTTNDTVYQYNLPTPWVLTGATYDSVSLSVNAQDAEPYAVTFNSDGTKMYIIGNINNTVYQYTTNDLLNMMTGALLGAAGDTDFPATTTTLDLLVVLSAATTTAPVFTALTFNYNANAVDELAVPGTDYTWTYPAAGQLNFQALTAGNYKIRAI